MQKFASTKISSRETLSYQTELPRRLISVRWLFSGITFLWIDYKNKLRPVSMLLLP